MKLYAAVRAMRGIALGAATGNPASALITEAISFLPLYHNMSATLGGIMALAYSGDMAGATFELLEAPIRKDLELEAFLLFFAITAILWSDGEVTHN